MSLGRYKALRKIADGGTAEVFLAEQQGAAGFRRLVVLKRIRAELYSDETFRRILVEEAHVTMGLHHSNLVTVLDLGESRGRYFLVLELVDGWTLQQLLDRAKAAQHPLPPEMAAYLVGEVCRALGYAHERTRAGVKLGIVHRDVCPNNVLLSDTGEVKLTDFGIAKARIRMSTSAIGTVAGKPQWMSPEQASGEQVDARSDLFSAGTLLYHLLTGEMPFKAPTERELMVRVASGEFVSPAKAKSSLPKDLVKVVLEAMQRDVKKRFQSAQAMLTALEKVERGALPPFGRSELEAWLRALNKKDGKVPVTRESMLPTPAKPQEPEWIELSSEELKTAPPVKVAPSKPKPASRMFPVLALLAALAMGAWWWLTREPEPSAPPPPRKVEKAPKAAPVVASPLPSRGEGQGEGTARPQEQPRTETPDALSPHPDPLPARGEGAQEPTPPPVVEAPPPPPPPPEQQQQQQPLKVSARSDPKATQGDHYGVAFESDPPGAKVLIDKRHLGTTPTSLRFKAGTPFELTFEHEGYAPLVQWLQLTERPDKPPRVSLKAPPPK